jgi:CheY-like chemotaxis protein
VAELAGMRVLVVDDNATNREVLHRRLESWSMRPTSLADGPSALRALYAGLESKQPFQVALIAMQVPGPDGESLATVVHSDRRLASLRSILLAPMGVQAPGSFHTKSGFRTVLTKPVSATGLLRALRAGHHPEARSAGATALPVSAALPACVHPARILLVEDNRINQQVALKMLEKLGYQADTASNGLEALAALESSAYDLALMDMEMPEMDGFEVIGRIRSPHSGERNRTLPVVALTAHAMYGDRELCLAAGANDYISKPLSIQDLGRALSLWLPQPDAN